MFQLNGEQAISSDSIALKRFVTREPISIFSLRKHAKNEEEKEQLNQLLELLKKKLPRGFKIGAAVDEGDSFFDSVAQGLNELRDRGLITESGGFNVKSLRESCKLYAKQVNQSNEDSWLENALKQEGRKLRKYIRNIEYTAKDIENASCCSKMKIMWGRPELEGNMLCEIFGVKFRILELRDEEMEGFVSKSKLGTGNIIIYLVNHGNHFVPLLSNIEKNIKRSIKVCTEEIYGNVTCSDARNFSQSYISALLQDIEDSSCKQNGHSESISKENRKMSRKRRCSVSDQDNEAPKRAKIEDDIIKEERIKFPSDVQDKFKQERLYRKRRFSVTDKDDKLSKRMCIDANVTNNEYLEFSKDFQAKELRENELNYQSNRCIPHQLIRFMYQLDLAVLCSVRECVYKYKYPFLSLTFRDSEIENLGDITLRYKDKSIFVKIVSVDKYYADNDINYGRLFNKENGKHFFLKNYFDSYVKLLISKLNSLSNNIEYLIIYTDSGLDVTGELRLKQSRSRNFYPFEFDSINMEKCGILKDMLFTNNNISGRDFYQFSQNKTNREEIFKRLEFSLAARKEIRKFSPEFEKEIKETFLDKLVFAVNQPDREELSSIVRNEINGKVTHNYMELQEKILCDLSAQKPNKKYGNDVSEINYSFSLLMSFLHDMFLNDHAFYLKFKGKSCNDLTINYKDRNTYIKILNAGSYIDYSHFFPSRTKEKKGKFSINKHFTFFIEELEKDEDLRYFIIYTNAGLDLTEEKRFKKVPSKDFYPLKFDSVDFQKKRYKIFRDSSCIDQNFLYKFSSEETTKLLSLLTFPSSFQRKRQENLSDEDEKDIKEKFLNKLIFAVNQPHRTEVNRIMRKEIGNKSHEIPYNYEELREISLRWLESQEFDHITKEIIEKLLVNIKSSRSSYPKMQLKNFSEEIKLAKSVVGRGGTTAFNQFLDFLIKGKGIKYLKVLKRQGINLANVSSILHVSGSSALKAFTDLYNLWFDEKGNKTQYIKTFEDQRVNLANMSCVLNGAGRDAAGVFKDLYNLWFDAKGNKTLYLKSLEDGGVSVRIMCSILHVAGSKAGKAFKDLYDLWFDAKGNKTLYLKALEDNGVNLPTMSSILGGAGSKAGKAFKDLYNLWFDAKGNKTEYLKTMEDNGVNLRNMSNMLSGTGSKAGQAFIDLYCLWFDAKGNKTLYLKALEDNGVNLPNMSSILGGAGSTAGKAFKDLYNLWFDAKGNKTLYLKTMEDNGVNLRNMSSILGKAGSKAGQAFIDLYDLWFDAKGNKTKYLKALEDEGVDLPNMSNILSGAGSKAGKAFIDLYDLWFDAKGNKTLYLKALEDEGVNLRNMSSILGKAGYKAGKAFIDLYDLWFDAKGNKTLYLKALEDNGVNLPTMSSILNGARSKAAKAFKDLYDLWFDSKGNKSWYLKSLEDEGVNLRSMSSILHRAGSQAVKAFKDLYDLWFDAKGMKTLYLKTLEYEGVNLPNMSTILSGAGFKADNAFKDLFDLWFDSKGNKTLYLNTLEDNGVNLRNMSRILSRAGSKAGKAFMDLFDLWFDVKGNKTPYLKTLEDNGVNLPNMSSILGGAGSKAGNAFKDLYDLWFDAKGNKTLYLNVLESNGLNLPNMSSILIGTGSMAGIAFKDLYDLWFDAKGNKTGFLKTLEDEGVNLLNISSILHGAGSKSGKTFKDLYYVWFDVKGNKRQFLTILEYEGVNLPNISSILIGSGSKAVKAFKDLYDIWFDEQGNQTEHLKHFINKNGRKKSFTLHDLSSILNGAGANARDAFEKLHNICFTDEGERTVLLDDLYRIGFKPRKLSCVLRGTGARASSTLKKLHGIFFNDEGGKTELIDDLYRIGFKPHHLSLVLCGEGAHAYSTLRKLYSVCFYEEERRIKILRDFFETVP